jgi:DNA-binding transcriptional LysR family regulator
MTMDRLGDMRLFTEAATLGSLSAAGRKLGLSPAAASARLLKLEKSLTARLFERTTRQLRLTDEGRLYLQHCRIALQAIDASTARPTAIWSRGAWRRTGVCCAHRRNTWRGTANRKRPPISPRTCSRCW